MLSRVLLAERTTYFFIMKETTLALAKKLISFETTAADEEALHAVLEIALKEVQEFTIERFKRNGVESALVYNTPKRPKKFKIILNAHLDIIPAKKNQYTPKIKGSRLYGAGAMDMKANAASLIAAF